MSRRDSLGIQRHLGQLFNRTLRRDPRPACLRHRPGTGGNGPFAADEQHKWRGRLPTLPRWAPLPFQTEVGAMARIGNQRHDVNE